MHPRVSLHVISGKALQSTVGAGDGANVVGVPVVGTGVGPVTIIVGVEVGLAVGA